MTLRSVPFVIFMLIAPSAQAANFCMRAVHPLSAGAVPATGDLVVAECGATRPELVVRYDRDMRATRLARAVAADEVVAAIPAAMIADIVPGQKLYVAVKIGPVVVQREVEALQPANLGQKLFVRAADGQVFSTLYAGDIQ